ncbi:hypothetical protein HETIRDRAFT_450437 [Heterobasidion irregulare TC 32-1]|uniref:Uncharacterized protein n=1 Tax=Heterobasidion irregulare (strain TC 32-1) TaxID=747525 RepID=W4KC23_HETIT|nr:uncharacterized protein HETIRDRAFT_450437 [Heterobasidion irregulare TC 32-1]ETW82631.1 hypothetical protein HETIRDRAFT_450437 [Heterobasidion irregulare TC 32-1]
MNWALEQWADEFGTPRSTTCQLGPRAVEHDLLVPGDALDRDVHRRAQRCALSSQTEPLSGTRVHVPGPGGAWPFDCV